MKEYAVTSEADPRYNCVAFAAGDTALWWENLAVPEPGFYWPPGAILAGDNQDIEALKRCFGAIGYEECAKGDLEEGYEKVALYAINKDDWTHAAVQQDNGDWCSKLGSGYDIRHKSPQCVVSQKYGKVMCYMKRGIAKVSYAKAKSERKPKHATDGEEPPAAHPA